MPGRITDCVWNEHFCTGTDTEAYRYLGAHIMSRGVRYALWAPGAKSVRLLTDRLDWQEVPMRREKTGIWTLTLDKAKAGDLYRFIVEGADGITRYKADPYAFRCELRPANASVVCPSDAYEWHDEAWCVQRGEADALSRPMAIYEVHPGSWKKDYRISEDGFLNYRTLADQLSDYVNYMGFTHVELIGICEHPLDASWGYQVTGYYAPTGRYGSPDDFRYFVDRMHQCGIGVILDWVPAHFPKDSFALETFDGTPLYESADPLLAEYPEWGTKAFDYSKGGVCSFMRSNAFYWVREFHIDALRVDAVASMLHTSFGRSEWRANPDGSTENHASIAFLRNLNAALRKETAAYMIAEDSSIMPGITKSTDEGGMGFGFKWNMGWMHDTLEYMEKDPLFRGWHHDQLTHSLDYAFLENFVLVLSHDEVVHLKHSMLEKMPGTLQDKLGALKTLYTYMFTHPGKKLLFMGQEFAEDREWSEEREINWALCEDAGHRDVMETLRSLLALYRELPCLHSDSQNPATFGWINRSDAMRSTVSFLRKNPWNFDGAVLVICNFSPQHYTDYTCGVPVPGWYERAFSTYDHLPGGGGPRELGGVPRQEVYAHWCDGCPWTLHYDLRPYESVIFRLPGKL